MVAIIIKNSVYKGEFIAHHCRQVKISVSSNSMSLTETAGRTVTRKIQRPPEEWIIVTVPAVVSIDDWDTANRMLEKNYQMGRRNAKEPFLLTGLIKCATCGHKYVGGRKTIIKGEKKLEYHLSCYRCSSRNSRMPIVTQRIGCDQSQISCRVLEEAVWSVIYQVLLDPQILIGALEREFKGDRNEQIHHQITFLENQNKESKLEDEKLYKAYLAEVFDETEYAERRKLIKDNQQKLLNEINRLRGNLMTPEQFDDRKQEIILISRNAAKNGLAINAPFEIRQRIIKTIVDKITLNTKEGWFELEGVIDGKYLVQNSNKNEEDVIPKEETENIVCIPMGRDSLQQPA